MVKIVSVTGLEPGSAVRSIIDRSLQGTLQVSPSILSKLMGDLTRKHLGVRFPGSVHYAPSCVEDGIGSRSGNQVTGEIVVKAAGATRAYHNITILPMVARCLTIPVHEDAYRHKARDFNDLFTIKGKSMLFRKSGGGIIGMFALTKRVFQKQDPSILPTDSDYSREIGNRFIKEWENQFSKAKNF